MLGSRFTARPALAALCGFGLIACASTAASASIVVDFDSASDLNDFVESGGSAVATYAWTNATVVGSPDGAVTSPNDGDTGEPGLFYDAATLDPNDGPLTVSAYFQASAATAGGNSRTFVGFANNNGINLSTDNGKIGVRVFKDVDPNDAEGNNFFFQLQNNQTATSFGADFALQDGHWYRLETTVTALSTAGNYLLEGELLHYGSDGLTLDPSFSRSGSLNVSNGNLQPDTTWAVSLLNQDNNGGATAFDNLNAFVVPEPATLVLATFAGVMVSGRPRRRVA